MENRKFQFLSWIIVVTIVITVFVQGYWNWRNYQENKRFLISEMQVALDNAVEQYYAELAKVHFLQLGNNRYAGKKIIRSTAKIDTLDWVMESDVEIAQISELHVNLDSMVNEPQTNMVIVSKYNTSDSVMPVEQEKQFMKLAAKIASSFESESLNKNKLDSLVIVEFKRKGIIQDFKITNQLDSPMHLTEVLLQANPTYLSPGTELYLSSEPSFRTILEKGIFGVFISLATAFIIIAVLIYLYRFIQHQKDLDMMKNDLISNITHEFKTPIATVSTALEAIEKFNSERDIAKTNKYLKLSNEQLNKLNNMVEKLLDTATMEEGELILKMEKIDLSKMLIEVVDKYQDSSDKKIERNIDENIVSSVDPFHFEHVISNLLDNALKYGGDTIKVELRANGAQIEMVIQDNGDGINKKEQHRVFDKFYRISDGNIHNIKGYGIGLYYAKTIVEKHNGTLVLMSNPGHTTFKISLNK